MADFSKAYIRVSKWENIKTKDGLIVYSKTEGDKGGETLFGISRKSHPEFLCWDWIDNLKKSGICSPLDISKEAIKNETLVNNIKGFYKRAYWDKFRGDSIDSQVFANKIMLLAVNAGVKVGIKTGQRACGINDDGKLGPETNAAFKKAGDKEIENFVKIGTEFYNAIVARDKTQEKFLRGWLNRLNDVG